MSENWKRKQVKAIDQAEEGAKNEQLIESGRIKHSNGIIL